MEDAPGKSHPPGRLYALMAGSFLLHLITLLLILFLCHRNGPSSFGFPGSPILTLHLAKASAFSPPGTAASAAAPPAPPTPEPLPTVPVAEPAPAPLSTTARTEVPVPPRPETTSPPESTTQGQTQGQGPSLAQKATTAEASSPAPTDGGASGSLSLFGLEGSGQRIALLFDVSDSVFLRRPGLFDSLYAEALARIDTLPPGVLFDLVVFKNGSLAWRPGPVAATEANRAEARKWLAKIARQGVHFSARGGTPGTLLYEGNGTRGDTALRQAMTFAPDWIILITDGQWQTFAQNAKPSPVDTDALLADLRAHPATEGQPLPKIDVLLLTSRSTTAGESSTARALSEQSGGKLLPLADEEVAPTAP